VITRGRTTIAIAHRLSTLRHASRILVFDKGALVEDGAHLELLAKDGIYANLIRMQSRLAENAPIETLAAAPPTPAVEKDRSLFEPRWLVSDRTKVSRSARGGVSMEIEGEPLHGGITAALAFPTQKGRWICVRSAAEGEKELGIIRDLDGWTTEARTLIEEALSKRYHLHVITAIDRIELVVAARSSPTSTRTSG
jgi:ATP-binding cassette, subfamily B, bacterial